MLLFPLRIFSDNLLCKGVLNNYFIDILRVNIDRDHIQQMVKNKSLKTKIGENSSSSILKITSPL